MHIIVLFINQIGDDEMPKPKNRPASSLSSTEVRRKSNREANYGVSSDTVTKNTGLILTDYMMKCITVTKLKDEADVNRERKKSAEEIRKEEAQKVLDDVFESYSRAHEEYSSFGFVNEGNGLSVVTDSPSLVPLGSSVSVSPKP
jgi:hypothetical protein